jgi:hypothetical protein
MSGAERRSFNPQVVIVWDGFLTNAAVRLTPIKVAVKCTVSLDTRFTVAAAHFTRGGG